MRDTTGPTGKHMNCESWATYESPGSSTTATICHGGRYKNHWETPCPSRYDCAKATQEKEQAEAREREQAEKRRVHLPMNPAAWSNQHQPRVVLSSSVTPSPALARLPTLKSSPSAPASYVEGGPVAITPPTSYPEVMRTPYALADRPAHAPLTPVFLPKDHAGVLERLLLNIIQGMLGSGAQHIVEYLRYVDIFGITEKR